MITLDGKEIISSLNIINTIAPQFGLNADAALDLRAIRSVLADRHEDINEERKKYIDNLATKDEEGTPKIVKTDGQEHYDFSDENKEIFNQRYQELLDKEFELDIRPVRADRLGDVKVSMDAIDFLIEVGILEE